MPDILVSSILAGLATVLGGVIVLFLGRPSDRVLGLFLGLASGVMLAVVAVDLLPAALEHGSRLSTTCGFALGVLLLASIGNTLARRQRRRKKQYSWRDSYVRMGILVALGIALHDLPEGLAIGAGFAATEELGTLLALAIGLHNIPEGIGLALPLLYGGWSAWQILSLCLLVAIVTPLGTLLSLLLLQLSPQAIAMSLAFAAGAMVFVVADELIPTSHDSSRLLTACGLTFGFAIILTIF
ncbi:MAG: ZIP family metal transporter [Firmicutes bacterium]|nr:ZIP family metal transporter [Bacillota bacterium]